MCCICYRIFVFFFFFQAEDGIRDWSVTGVQTCALPIWAVFQTLNVRGAWTYDRCTSGGIWRSWSVGRPAGQNGLQTASHTAGLIVDTVSAGTFAVAGIVPTSTSIPLCAGWNLVGNPSFRVGYTVG